MVSKHDRRQREVFFTGRVQGVGFRYTVRSLAARSAVAGFVRNLPDGRVHLVVEGAAEEIAGFMDAVKHEMERYISDIQETERPGDGRLQEFEIRF